MYSSNFINNIISCQLHAMVACKKITNGCDNGSNCNNMILTVLPQIIEHAKVQWHMLMEIQGLAWDRHINVTGLNRLMVSHPHFNKDKTDININNEKLKQIHFNSIWPHTITKINDNRNLDSALAWSVNMVLIVN